MQFEPLRVRLGVGKVHGGKLLRHGAFVEESSVMKIGQTEQCVPVCGTSQAHIKKIYLPDRWIFTGAQRKPMTG